MAKRVAPAVLSVILVDTEVSTVSEKPLGQGPCAIRLGGSKIARRERINDVLAKFVLGKGPIVERHLEVCEVKSYVRMKMTRLGVSIAEKAMTLRSQSIPQMEMVERVEQDVHTCLLRELALGSHESVFQMSNWVRIHELA